MQYSIQEEKFLLLHNQLTIKASINIKSVKSPSPYSPFSFSKFLICKNVTSVIDFDDFYFFLTPTINKHHHPYSVGTFLVNYCTTTTHFNIIHNPIILKWKSHESCKYLPKTIQLLTIPSYNFVQCRSVSKNTTALFRKYLCLQGSILRDNNWVIICFSY